MLNSVLSFGRLTASAATRIGLERCPGVLLHTSDRHRCRSSEWLSPDSLLSMEPQTFSHAGLQVAVKADDDDEESPGEAGIPRFSRFCMYHKLYLFSSWETVARGTSAGKLGLWKTERMPTDGSKGAGCPEGWQETQGDKCDMVCSQFAQGMPGHTCQSH